MANSLSLFPYQVAHGRMDGYGGFSILTLCSISKVTRRNWVCNSKSLSFLFSIQILAFLQKLPTTLDCFCFLSSLYVFPLICLNKYSLKHHLQNSLPIWLQLPSPCTQLFLFLLVNTYSKKILVPSRNILQYSWSSWSVIRLYPPGKYLAPGSELLIVWWS